MSGDDLCFLSATELRGRIGAREISPRDVVSAVLARAERLQPELNCFITLCADEAMAEAKGWDPLESTCRHASLSIL